MKEEAAGFERLPLRYKNVFLDVARPMRCAPGAVICRQGESDRRLFLLTRGRLAVLHEDSHGRRTKVGTLTPGHVFGELNFIFGDRRIASVVAETESVVHGLERWQANEIISRMPSLFHFLERVGLQRWNLSSLLVHPLLQPLSMDLRRRLAREAYFLTLEGGNVLYDVGQVLDRCWLLLSGRMALVGEEGRRLELLGRAFPVPRECLHGQAGGWKATAVSECMTAGLTWSAVRDCLKAEPAFSIALETAAIG